MFHELLYRLRDEGLPVGLREWRDLLTALDAGVIGSVDRLYRVGRAIVCRTEADYDAWDLAFAKTFHEAIADEAFREQLLSWLKEAAEKAEAELVDPGLSDPELWEQFLERLKEQEEAHHGGSKWIGTGGTSPYGHSGRSSRGIRVGGRGGNRSAIHVATERRFEGYRADRTLDHRDMAVALKALRKLQREGRWELDIDGTIDTTARNAGEIEIVERRERENAVRLVLLMDAGGSMEPHARRVAELFTAAEAAGCFKSLEAVYFHNCVYRFVWTDADMTQREPTSELLARLTPRHRLLFVGDASMAPYELFSAVGWGFEDVDRRPGIAWLRDLRTRCPASAWLNPDPRRWWNHPTVSAIGEVFPMKELTLDGLREAVGVLRRPV